jgi:hypothetical protein
MFIYNGIKFFTLDEIRRNTDADLSKLNHLKTDRFKCLIRENVHIVKPPVVIKPETIQKKIADAKDAALHDAVALIVSKIKWSVIRQEDPKYRVIKECEIIPNRYVNEVWIRSNCDGWCEDVKMLFSYYPDELVFSPCEFIGLTETAAEQMFHRRDIAYLQS